MGPDARDRYPEPVHILVTGFEPFGGDDVNPSAELVARLRGEVATAVLPVEFEALRELVPALLAEHHPSHVVCLGLSGRATGLTLERVALNLADARIPDNAGHQPIDQSIVPDGPPGNQHSRRTLAQRRKLCLQRPALPHAARGGSDTGAAEPQVWVHSCPACRRPGS